MNKVKTMTAEPSQESLSDVKTTILEPRQQSFSDVPKIYFKETNMDTVRKNNLDASG